MKDYRQEQEMWVYSHTEYFIEKVLPMDGRISFAIIIKTTFRLLWLLVKWKLSLNLSRVVSINISVTRAHFVSIVIEKRVLLFRTVLVTSLGRMTTILMRSWYLILEKSLPILRRIFLR